MKICPKCGSTEVDPVAGGITGAYQCRKCGFGGVLFPEFDKEENEEDKKKKKKKKNKEK